MPHVGAFVLPLPPINEQRGILDNIRRKTDGIRRLLTSARQRLTSSTRFTFRLIADIVTGKLDVREAAAILPDEPEEIQAVEEPDEIDQIDEELETADLDEATAEARYQ